MIALFTVVMVVDIERAWLRTEQSEGVQGMLAMLPVPLSESKGDDTNTGEKTIAKAAIRLLGKLIGRLDD